MPESEVRRRFEAVERRLMELTEDYWELWRLLLQHHKRLEALEQQAPKQARKKSRRRGTKK